MRQVILPGTKISLSRFSFGTGSLFNVGSSVNRANLLAAAFDHGFTHFDTAPYYGFGIAERDLKPLLKAHPNITVATKVGLYSPGGEAQSSTLVFLRKTAGKVLPALSRPEADFNVARARKALEGSLKRLGRERIDLYLLHEPKPQLLNTDEWVRWLESEKSRVAYFGLAVSAARLRLFLAPGSPPWPVIQTTDSIEAREADLLEQHIRPMQITYGYVSAAIRAGKMDVASVLTQALRRNRTGSVIVSTRKTERLRQYGEICEAAHKPEAV
jgi:D-threo-aldose 1-dehydrogenase